MFIPHSALVQSEHSEPKRWLYALHGIYGRGGNLRSLARRVVQAKPDVGVVLVDLRMHGQSQGAPVPHTIWAVAADIEQLIEHRGHKGKVALVMGHSFGGKVALALRRAESLRKVATVVLDSSPSAKPGALDESRHTVIRFLHDLAAMPEFFESRQEFQSWMEERGYSGGLLAWLAMNLAAQDKRWRFILEHDAMRALLESHFETDLWDLVGPGLSIVVAGKDSSISLADIERFKQTDGVKMQILKDAGHWLHVDAPDRTLRSITSALPD